MGGGCGKRVVRGVLERQDHKEDGGGGGGGGPLLW
jgi:hypothetical protein